MYPSLMQENDQRFKYFCQASDSQDTLEAKIDEETHEDII